MEYRLAKMGGIVTEVEAPQKKGTRDVLMGELGRRGSSSDEGSGDDDW